MSVKFWVDSEDSKAFWALILTAFVVFGVTFFNVWTYDDVKLVERNPDIRSFAAFLADKYPGRPLRELTLMLDYRLFGANPGGYHFQNILWHGFNAWLIFLLGRRLIGGGLSAFTGALFFLIHPIQVEVVAAASHRKDSLALFFSLLALLLYMRFVQEMRWRWLMFAALAFFLGCFAKQTAVVVPVLVVALEWLMIPAERRVLLRSPRVVLAGVFLSAVVGAIWVWRSGVWEGRIWEMQGLLARLGVTRSVSEWEFYLVAMKASGLMLQRVFWPFDLGVEYVFDAPASVLDAGVAIFLAFLSAGVFLLFQARRYAVLLFAWLWFFLFLLPASNLVWPLSYLMADRYLYAPMGGVAIAVTFFVKKLCCRHPKKTIAAFIMVGLFFSVLSVRQSMVWRSPLALWTHAVRVSPESHHAHFFLGLVYLDDFGQPGDAIPHLRKAAEFAYLPNAGVALEKARAMKAYLDYRKKLR